MALVSLVVRDGIAELYDGKRRVAFPGVVARVNGQEDWVAGPNVLQAAGPRLRLEEAGDAAAYWAVLAEGLLTLRAAGVSNIVVGMGEEEYERVGREVGQFIKSQCGGRVALRHGDHFALYALEPWDKGQVPDDTQQTVVLRVGASRVQAISLSGGTVAGEFGIQPGWEEAVVWATVRQAFAAGRRLDVHEATWELVSAAPSDAVTGFVKTLADQVSAAGWQGRQLVISGVAGQLVGRLLQSTATASPETVHFAEEAVGLWNLARLQGLGQ